MRLSYYMSSINLSACLSVRLNPRTQIKIFDYAILDWLLESSSVFYNSLIWFILRCTGSCVSFLKILLEISFQCLLRFSQIPAKIYRSFEVFRNSLKIFNFRDYWGLALNRDVLGVPFHLPWFKISNHWRILIHCQLHTTHRAFLNP